MFLGVVDQIEMTLIFAFDQKKCWEGGWGGAPNHMWSMWGPAQYKLPFGLNSFHQDFIMKTLPPLFTRLQKIIISWVMDDDNVYLNGNAYFEWLINQDHDGKACKVDRRQEEKVVWETN